MRTFASAWLGLCIFTLTGCSSSTLESVSPVPWMPTDARTRYLPVNDLPPDRDEPPIPPDQRARIEAELAAARDRQAPATAAGNSK